ncbi:MAG: type 4a pilus biogenesis protein PilO [Candidatus Electryonea clarkiae]|nr:type 4a pilus biogenesis protein PilO [Candidatus Electryonea clarkiae]MDP8288691.1 type 4a pilus biogenesis protein PilO [Candidatus Electryonea clarkiae]
MKKLIYLFTLFILFGLAVFGYYRFEYPKLPREIEALNKRIKAKNEKLISAQILAQELDLVAKLIDRNLAISAKDSLAQDASLPFLEYTTTMLNDLKIKLITLEPSRRRVTRHDYVKTSYELVVECSYEEFGKFINDLEKSERIISIEEFELQNKLQKVMSRKERERFDTHIFELKISTLTLIKHT